MAAVKSVAVNRGAVNQGFTVVRLQGGGGFRPECFENSFSVYRLTQKVLKPQTLWHHGGGHAHFPAKKYIYIFFKA